jgi:predicted N-acetyltransferase YhbS
MFQIRAEAPGDGAAIEILLDEAFGIRRHAKISYRYRIGRPPVDALSSVAIEGPILVGSIRYWTIRLDGRPALLLGPLAIEPHLRGVGIGRALVRQTLARAADLG